MAAALITDVHTLGKCSSNVSGFRQDRSMNFEWTVADEARRSRVSREKMAYSPFTIIAVAELFTHHKSALRMSVAAGRIGA